MVSAAARPVVRFGFELLQPPFLGAASRIAGHKQAPKQFKLFGKYAKPRCTWFEIVLGALLQQAGIRKLLGLLLFAARHIVTRRGLIFVAARTAPKNEPRMAATEPPTYRRIYTPAEVAVHNAKEVGEDELATAQIPQRLHT